MGINYTVDNKLNWKPHVDNIKTKLSKSIAILYKTNLHLPNANEKNRNTAKIVNLKSFLSSRVFQQF